MKKQISVHSLASVSEVHPTRGVQKLVQNMAQNDVALIQNEFDADAFRLVNIFKKNLDSPGVSNSNLDFDLIDAGDFIEEDSVNGTDINGKVTLHNIDDGPLILETGAFLTQLSGNGNHSIVSLNSVTRYMGGQVYFELDLLTITGGRLRVAIKDISGNQLVISSDFSDFQGGLLKAVAGDRYGVAIDFDIGAFKIYKNNILVDDKSFIIPSEECYIQSQVLYFDLPYTIITQVVNDPLQFLYNPYPLYDQGIGTREKSYQKTTEEVAINGLVIHGDETIEGTFNIIKQGAPSQVPGKFGNGYHFDGVDDLLTCDISSINLSGDFTIDGWIKCGVTGQPILKIVNSLDAADYNNNFVLFWMDTSANLIVYFTGSMPLQLESANALTGTEYAHIAVVQSGTILSLYKNGILISSRDRGSVPLHPEFANILTVGGSGFWNEHMESYFDEIRVSSVAEWTSEFTPPTSPYAPVPANPPKQVTTSNNNQLYLLAISIINSILITHTEPVNTSLTALVSFDGRATWNKFNGTSFVDASSEFTNKTGWNTISEIEAAFSSFSISDESTLDFAFLLETTDSTVTPSIDQITINYDENGLYQLVPDTSYEVKVVSATETQIKKLSAGVDESVKINVIA